MKITDIKVFPVREDKLKAFISIVLDECFMVNDIKVIRGKDGFFISMPSRRKRNGKFKDIAHPLNNETRQSMEKEILAAYEEALDESADERGEVKARPTRPPERREGREPAIRERRETPKSDVIPAPVPIEPERASDRRDAGKELSMPPEPSEAEVRVVAKDEPARRTDAAAKPEPDGESETAERTAEEVAEEHLRDSFWGT